MNLDVIAVFGFLALAGWDGWRRNLAHSKYLQDQAERERAAERAQEEKIANTAVASLVARLVDFRASTEALTTELGEQKAQFRATLTTFLSTVLDALKIAAEDRQRLENRMAAGKIKEKGGL